MIIRRSLAGVHYGSQDTNGAVYRPNLHSAHMPIFEVIVRPETLPLHQLLLRVHPRTLHKIAKEVRVLNGWPKTHVVLELAIVPRSERVICLLQSKYLSLARYLALAAGSRYLYCSLISPHRYELTFQPLSHQRNDVMCFCQLTFLQIPARNPRIEWSLCALCTFINFFVPSHLQDCECVGKHYLTDEAYFV